MVPGLRFNPFLALDSVRVQKHMGILLNVGRLHLIIVIFLAIALYLQYKSFIIGSTSCTDYNTVKIN